MNSESSAVLAAKFRAKDALVAVVGLGYVGLPLAVRMAEAGFRTLGIDIDAEKVAKLGAGRPRLLGSNPGSAETI